MFLNIIFALCCGMIARIAWLLHKEKGGRRMKHKHFNGRFYW